MLQFQLSTKQQAWNFALYKQHYCPSQGTYKPCFFKNEFQYLTLPVDISINTSSAQKTTARSQYGLLNAEWVNATPCVSRHSQAVECGRDLASSLCLCPLFRKSGIRYRRENNEAVAGLFTQVGDLYLVHHIWGEITKTPRTN